MSKTRQKILIPKSKSWKVQPTLILISMTLLLPVCRALAQPWFFPTDGVDSVFFENTSDQDQQVWLSGPQSPQQNFAEQALQVPAHQRLSIDLSKTQNTPWLVINSYSQITAQTTLSSNKRTYALGPGRSDTLQLATNINADKGQLELVNLSANEQQVEIQVQNKFNSAQESSTLQLAAFEKKTIDIALESWDQLTVLGQYSLAATWNGNQVILGLTPARSRQVLSAPNNSAYFLMSNTAQTESYIFSTQDQKIINSARAQIQNPAQAQILFAKVALGHGGINRDILNPLKTVWSWHVSEALEFGSLASQDCDGSPAVIEDHLLALLSGTSIICFWNYKVIRELSNSDINPYLESSRP